MSTNINKDQQRVLEGTCDGCVAKEIKTVAEMGKQAVAEDFAPLLKMDGGYRTVFAGDVSSLRTTVAREDFTKFTVAGKGLWINNTSVWRKWIVG